LLASDLFVAVELQTEVLLQSGEESNHQQGCQANGDHQFEHCVGGSSSIGDQPSRSAG
jgi:hypothetical protein